MPNRLQELADSLGPAARRTRERPSKRKRARSPITPALASVGPARGPAAPKAAVAKAAAAIDYTVPGLVAPVAQPSTMTCWATVATMMVMWREQASMPIQTAMQRIGPAYLAKFSGNQGLTTAEKPAFLAAAGLAYEYPQSLAPSGWEGLLRKFGPLWVTTDENPGAGFSIHARIMTGIHGDGTAGGTSIDIVDPAGGRTYRETFGTFVSKYESEAMDPKRPLRLQIVHWPQDVARNVARTQGARASAYAQSLGVGRFATVDDAEFEPHDREDAHGHRGARAHSAFAHGLDAPKVMGASDVHWAADADSIDYRHLATAIDIKPFELTADVLDRLARVNRFAVDGVDPRVVFGLRGCTADANVSTPADKVTLREIEPNHIDNRCIIGVWDRSSNTVAAFQASTVPNWEYMETYRENHGKKANLLPTGYYRLTVGTHRAKKKNAAGERVDNPKRIQGALRNDQEVLVLRSEDDLTYTVRDTWDKTVPNDNLHPGVVAVNPGGSTVPDYSSAGCNTIPGSSTDDRPDGAWADFRTALGLDNARPTADDGRAFGYMLLTGREARLGAAGSATLARLRFGSHGEEVRQLQEALGKHAKKYYKGKADGDFGAGTAMAVVRYQKDQAGGAADAIVTPTDATALGVTLASAAVTSGAKAFDAADLAGDAAKWIWKKLTSRQEEGRFKVVSDVVDLLHEDTPPLAQWTFREARFVLAAFQQGADSKAFPLRLEFEFNGHDIKNAHVLREVEGAPKLNEGQFTINFVAQKNLKPAGDIAQLDFLINGTWDHPGAGKKAFDFSGRLHLTGTGEMSLELRPSPGVSVQKLSGMVFRTVKDVKRPAPQVGRQWHAVFFANNKSEITDEQRTRFKKWVARLKPSDPQDRSSEQAVRWQRLTSGKLVIHVDAYASAPGSGTLNQKLTDARAKAIKELVQQNISSAAVVVTSSQGEFDPSDKGGDKSPEDINWLERRVEVWFEYTK